MKEFWNWNSIAKQARHEVLPRTEIHIVKAFVTQVLIYAVHVDNQYVTPNALYIMGASNSKEKSMNIEHRHAIHIVVISIFSFSINIQGKRFKSEFQHWLKKEV